MGEWPTYSAPKIGDLQAHAAAKASGRGAPKTGATGLQFYSDGRSLFVNGARASMDPTVAIIGAAALNRAVKQPTVNKFLTNASKPTVVAARESMNELFKKSAATSVARGVTAASAEAAKRGALLGSRFAATALLRAGTMSMPVVGLAINAGLWVFDTGERKAFNNFVSTVLGGHAAPDLNAPPSPPRTQFLPITQDGNRDPIIEKMDQGMVNSNTATFGFKPDHVWPSHPEIATTSNFGPMLARYTEISKKLDTLHEAMAAAFNQGQGDKYVAMLWSKTKQGVDALEDLKSTVIPTLGAQITQGATAGNNAYQAFRKVNADNRAEINNSTSGLIPFRANHVNESKMSDSTAEMKAAADAMGRAAQGVASAADNFTIQPSGVTLPSDTTTSRGPTTPAGPAKTPPAGSPVPAAPVVKPDAIKDTMNALRGGMPTGMGMPQMPSLPTLPGLGPGGAPQVPGLNNAGPKPLDQALLDKLKDKDKDFKIKPEDKDKPKVDPGTGAPVANTTTGPGKAVPVGTTTPPAGNPAANTLQIKGKTFTFDSPKLKDFVHNLIGQDGAAHKSVRQAAAAAGFPLPPPGEDIGRKIDNPAQFKAGMPFMGPNNQNAVFLGEQGGQAWVYSETQGLTTLDKLPKPDGPHQGFFALTDAGTPTQQPQVQQTAAPAQTLAADQPPAPPAPPAGSPSAADTNTGIGQAKTTAPIGLNPGNVPPGN